MQRVDHPDPAAANEQALHDLENGATGLTIVCGARSTPTATGSTARSKRWSACSTASISMPASPSISTSAAETRDAAKNFAALVKKRGIAPGTVEMRASLNPLGHHGGDRRHGPPGRSSRRTSRRWSNELADEGFRGPFAVADGRVIHNAGGSEAQELAFALASAVAYLRALEAGGIALDAARRMIYFRLAADADQFLTIAKFRALRKLWARVEQACGCARARLMSRPRPRGA